MFFKVSPSIFRDYPGTVIGVVVAHGIKNGPSNKEVQELLAKTQNELRSHLTMEQLQVHPHIEPWINAYKKFGAKPKSHIPSVKNLSERVLKGSLPSITTLVDLYNIISLKYLLPAGGEDLAKILGNIELTIAGSDEKPVMLLGDKEARAPEQGEVMYKDDNGAICRRWNWREADRTKLTPGTTDAFFVIEALPSVDAQMVETAAHELAGLIEKYCGGSATIALVTKETPEIGLQKQDKYLKLNPRQDVSHEQINVYVPKKHAAAQVHPEHDDSAQHRIRVEKIKKLRELGIEPWPENKEISATCQTVIDEFDREAEKKEYQIAGRILTLREHGKTIFAHIQDRSGRLQLYFRKDELGDAAFNELTHLIDVGDIIWVSGVSFKTKLGEITLKANSFSLLSKCLYPLPEKFHGLADIETIYRQRYLDLISNPASRDRFIKRSKIIREIRHFLDAHEYFEVETPMLHPIPGGAAARPFMTHHNALDTTLYMRIAPELYLKRLVVGGIERVYEVNRNFRNEGISTRHNPEFTMLEFYTAYKDYHFGMDFTEKLIRTVASAVCHDLAVPFGDVELDFRSPFVRLSMRDAVKKYGNLSEADLSDSGIDAAIKKHSIHLADSNASWGQKLYALFETLVESKLAQPTFITDFPIEVSPLAKRDPKNPNIAARFELFIAGIELSNGFNELNDPFDQASRFKQQVESRESGDAEAHHYDADYVHALEYGLAPAVGVGIGIDRLAMFLTNTTSIKDVILFPTLKKK